MRDDTPYAQPPAVLARKAACMEWVLREAPLVSYVLEAFCGLGVTTEQLARRFPSVLIRSVDRDPDCVRAALERAWVHRNVQFVRGDALAELRSWSSESVLGVSLDFNQFTLLDLTQRKGWRRDVLLAALALRPVWLQLTDTAVGKLHLHWRDSYGLRDGEYYTYLSALDEWFGAQGLRVTRGARRSTSSYLLLERKRDFLSSEWRSGETDVAGVQLFERT